MFSSMTTEEKNKYKLEFETALNALIQELEPAISGEDGQWNIKGFIDIYKNIYTISSDTKIISKILEIHTFPEIMKFAEIYGYSIVLAEKQNWYPDLTFIRKDNNDVKFALDLKTTYRRNAKTAGFTLGSHGKYFIDRQNAKNIQFPYCEYLGHYCLGIIYTRTDNDDLKDTEIIHVKDLEEEGDIIDPINDRQVINVDKLTSITSQIKDFDVFLAEKWKIACDSQGSGNTANIGSVTDVNDLKNGSGVFSKLGERWFDEYWINYGKVHIIRDNKSVPVTNIWDFLEFKNRKDLFDKVGNGAKRRKK